MSGKGFAENGSEKTEEKIVEKTEVKRQTVKNTEFPYADLLDMSRPVSKKHPPMSLYDRAAQFSAFAALTGHGEAIRQTADMVEEKVALEIEREIPEDI